MRLACHAAEVGGNGEEGRGGGKERWEGRGGVGRKGREESEGKGKVKGRENRSVIEWLNGFVL